MASPCPTVPSHDEWLDVPDTVQNHFQQTPRKRPIHRSAVYRWIRTGKVEARQYGERWYISRESLTAYCQGRPNTKTPRTRPSEDKRGQAARDRLLNITTPPQTGGER
jgi:hypothetical protein